MELAMLDRRVMALLGLCLGLMMNSCVAGAQSNCTVSCPKNRLSQLDLDPAAIRDAQIHAIKLKILRHLGSQHATNTDVVPNRSREALALLAANTLAAGHSPTDQNYFPEPTDHQQESKMVLFPDDDISCPTDEIDGTLTCLKFDVSRVARSGGVIRAEIGIFLLPGHNESYTLQEIRKNNAYGTPLEGVPTKGWLRFDATPLVARWAREMRGDALLKPTAAAGITGSSSRLVRIACSTCVNATHNHIEDAQESPFLFVVVAPPKAGAADAGRRVKRSADCSLTDMQRGCCRAPFDVDIHDDIGWHWIVMPKTFSPNFCRGQCELEVNMLGPHGLAKNSYIKNFPRHARNIELALCCAPKKMRPLTIVYFADKHTLNVTTIPDMIVDECHCT